MHRVNKVVPNKNLTVEVEKISYPIYRNDIPSKDELIAECDTNCLGHIIVDNGNYENYSISYQKSKLSRISQLFACRLEILPHCCGIIELGNLEEYKPSKGESIEFYKQFDIFFKNLFAISTSNKKSKSCVNTLMINTTDSTPNLVKFLENSDYFTCVKEFYNANTGNLIKMWVSNN